MLNLATLTLLLGNFLLIGALPRCFFRRGRHNLRWWATALPFFVMPVLVLLAWTGRLPAWPGHGSAAAALQVAGTGLSVASVLLLGMTLGSHRIPLALWHQDDDAPCEVVTWGPYARVRHPFYLAFILAFLGATIVAIHPATLACTAYGGAALLLAARREEARLMASPLGDTYRDYAARTGRFLPKVRA